MAMAARRAEQHSYGHDGQRRRNRFDSNYTVATGEPPTHRAPSSAYTGLDKETPGGVELGDSPDARARAYVSSSSSRGRRAAAPFLERRRRARESDDARSDSDRSESEFSLGDELSTDANGTKTEASSERGDDGQGSPTEDYMRGPIAMEVLSNPLLDATDRKNLAAVVRAMQPAISMKEAAVESSCHAIVEEDRGITHGYYVIANFSPAWNDTVKLSYDDQLPLATLNSFLVPQNRIHVAFVDGGSSLVWRACVLTAGSAALQQKVGVGSSPLAHEVEVTASSQMGVATFDLDSLRVESLSEVSPAARNIAMNVISVMRAALKNKPATVIFSSDDAEETGLVSARRGVYDIQACIRPHTDANVALSFAELYHLTKFDEELVPPTHNYVSYTGGESALVWHVGILFTPPSSGSSRTRGSSRSRNRNRRKRVKR